MLTPKKFLVLFAAVFLFAGSVFAGENLLKGGDAEPESFKLWRGPISKNTDEVHSGQMSMECSQRALLTSQEFIEIDPEKSYELKAFFKAAEGEEPAKGYLGLRFYNAEKVQLPPVSIFPVPGTETTLAADAHVGDKTVLIATSIWRTKPSTTLYGVAFDAKEDLSDLPNLDTERIAKIEPKGGNVELTLRSALQKAWPAGTPVRQHRYVDYPGTQYTAGTEWKECTLKFSGGYEPGTKPGAGVFWKSAKYVQVNIFFNSDRQKDNYAKILADDISFSEVAAGGDREGDKGDSPEAAAAGDREGPRDGEREGPRDGDREGVAPLPVMGKNLLKGGDAEDAAPFKLWRGSIGKNTGEKHSGEASFECKVKSWMISQALIEVDPEKSYELKAFFKVAKGGKPAKGLFGLRLFNADKVELSPVAIFPVKGTQTTLAADANVGDKTILVAPSVWTTKPNVGLYGVAFDIKEDLSDLPNLNAKRITKIEEKGGNLELTLRSPLQKAWPAGTPVREHRYVDYPTVQYTAGAEWTPLTVRFSGQNEPGARPAQGMFWKGTQYVAVSIFFNMDRKNDNLATILVDDITFSEVSKERAKRSDRGDAGEGGRRDGRSDREGDRGHSPEADAAGDREGPRDGERGSSKEGFRDGDREGVRDGPLNGDREGPGRGDKGNRRDDRGDREGDR